MSEDYERDLEVDLWNIYSIGEVSGQCMSQGCEDRAKKEVKELIKNIVSCSGPRQKENLLEGC